MEDHLSAIGFCQTLPMLNKVSTLDYYWPFHTMFTTLKRFIGETAKESDLLFYMAYLGEKGND